MAEPFPASETKVGRRRLTDMRAIWNAIRYIVRTGCQWALLPGDFPPFTTVQHHFRRLCDVINEALAC